MPHGAGQSAGSRFFSLRVTRMSIELSRTQTCIEDERKTDCQQSRSWLDITKLKRCVGVCFAAKFLESGVLTINIC